MNRPKLIEKIRALMHRNFPEAETIIYGSEARGEARPDSDVDLLVLLPDHLDNVSFKEQKYTVLDRLFDLEITEIANLSPIVMQRKEWYAHTTPFTINVNREGIRL